MICKVLTTKDPNLRQVSKPVIKFDKKIAQLIKNLEDTLEAQKDPEGVGLAAPQIGVFLRVFIMRYQGKITPVVNPEILKISKKTNSPVPTRKRANEKTPASPRGERSEHIMEGCLSLPHYYGPVERAWEITVKYQVPKLVIGNWSLVIVQRTFTGFPAHIIQHEIDHLNGKVFLDRLFEQKRQLFQLKNNEWQEVELP